MSSWADASDDPPLEQAPAEYTGGGGVRPRLQLKPRSATAGKSTASGGGSSKSNPFGAAKPREEVLASKGIDASLVDKRVERKASVPRLTADQDRQVEDLRKELTEIEEKLREANEMELPEEDFRVAAEEKREDLNGLVKGFHDLNLKERNARDAERSETRGGGGDGSGGGGGGGRGRGGHGDNPSSPSGGGGGGSRKFERPSERRRRLEQQRHEGGEHHQGSHGAGGGGGGRYNDYDEGGGGGGEDSYSSFGGNRGRGGGGGRHSDQRGGRGGQSDRGGGGYGDHNDGGRSNDNNYDDKYAGDRYNY